MRDTSALSTDAPFTPSPLAPPAMPPPLPARALTPPETCKTGDRFHDYVLAEYEPVASPVGKLRSLALLVESFALGGVEAEGVALVNALRQGLGPFRTVWGIKHHHARGELGWELYFYDFQRAHADLSIPRVSELLAPHVKVGGSEPHPLPWHMFSVEVGPKQLREGQPASLDVYIDMRSYKSAPEGLTFENVYTFHDALAEIDDVIHRLRSSIHFDAKVDPLHRLLPPHLFNCRKICVANKRQSDAIYFSRVKTPALVRFLDDQHWPAGLRDFVRPREAELNHLLWDVGVDFRAEHGRAVAVKTGIYGSF